MLSVHVSDSLLGEVVQPGSLSLFSSTSANPLALWLTQEDPDLEDDSGIRLVVDATDAVAAADPGIAPTPLRLKTNDVTRVACCEPVLHIQSPAIRNTFIRSPPQDNAELCIRSPHISFQFRTLGVHRTFAFEVGIKDQGGQRGVFRVSRFQTEPKLYLRRSQGEGHVGTNNTEDRTYQIEPLLHLPLTMADQPEESEASMTAWQVLTLPLHHLSRHLSDTSLTTDGCLDSPSKLRAFGTFQSISYVKVYANVRLRRVWCSQHLPDHDLPEFQLFS